MLVSGGESRISDHFELSEGFCGLTSCGFWCVLVLSGKRSFPGHGVIASIQRGAPASST
jgi:hypothetical protein